MPSKDMQKAMDDMFKESEKLFKEMDKVFKTMEETLETVQKSAPAATWEPWFAWYPVRVYKKWRWMTTVYRRYNWANSTEQPFGDSYDYGTVFDAIRDSGKGF